MRGQKPDGQMQPSEKKKEKSTVIKQNLAGQYQRPPMRRNQNVLIWLVFALDTVVTGG